jgi:hypothetical protein
MRGDEAMIRKQRKTPDAADIAAHEEEVARYLADAFEPHEIANLKPFPISDRLTLALGRTYLTLQVIGNINGIESAEFAGCSGSLAWLIRAIKRQVPIERGSASS